MTIRHKKNIKILIIALFALGVFGLSAQPAQAGFWDFLGGLLLGPVLLIVSWVLYIPIYFTGAIIGTLVIPLLVWVANYNNFINQPGVSDGWVIVRDLANMFVVLGMLIIAMGTLFNVESYSYKKLLPKLVLAAIAINFSKMLMGFLIDISQVVTLTFVKAFSVVAAGNIVDAMGISKVLSLRSSLGMIFSGVTAQLAIIATLILGGIILIITAAILFVLIAYFVSRIIILWIAIVLSPLLFAMPLLPAGNKFADQIWQTVSKNLISGPMLAFFLWLSFLIMQKSAGGMSTQFDASAIGNVSSFSAFFSKVGTIDTILNFFLVVGLLMTSLMLASQMGAAGSKVAGNFVQKFQKAGSWLGNLPKRGAVGLGRAADRASLRLQNKLPENKRISLRPSILKKAWADRSERKEKRLYGAVTAGMTDRLAAKEDKGKAYRGYRAEKERKEREEMSSMPGANNPQMQIAQIKSKAKLDEYGKIIGLKNTSDAPAIAASLLELAKQGELATAYAELFHGALNNENFEELFRRLIPDDQKYADEIGSRAQKISQENGNIQYTRYGAQFKDGKAQIVLVDDRNERVRDGIAIAEEGTGNGSIRVANPNRYVKVDELGKPTNEFEEGGAKRFAIDAAQYIANPGSSKKKTREWAVSSAGRQFLENGLRTALRNGEIDQREYDLSIDALKSLDYFNTTGYKRQRGGTGSAGGPAGGSGGRRGGGGPSSSGSSGTGPTSSGPSGTGPTGSGPGGTGPTGGPAGTWPGTAYGFPDYGDIEDVDYTEVEDKAVRRVADDFEKYMEETIAGLKNRKIKFSDLFEGGSRAKEFSAKIDGLGQLLKDERQRKQFFDFASGTKLKESGNIKSEQAQELFLQNLSALASRMKEASKKPMDPSSTSGGSSGTGNPDDEDEEDEEDNTKI